MGRYISKAGRGPPLALKKKLRTFEDVLRIEMEKQQPNIRLLKKMQEEIEDMADGFDISIMWTGFSSSDMAAEMSGSCFGFWHMRNIVPRWRR